MSIIENILHPHSSWGYQEAFPSLGQKTSAKELTWHRAGLYTKAQLCGSSRLSWQLCGLWCSGRLCGEIGLWFDLMDGEYMGRETQKKKAQKQK